MYDPSNVPNPVVTRKIKNPSNLEGKSSKFPRLFRFCLLIWSGSVRVSLLCSDLLWFYLLVWYIWFGWDFLWYGMVARQRNQGGPARTAGVVVG